MLTKYQQLTQSIIFKKLLFQVHFSSTFFKYIFQVHFSVPFQKYQSLKAISLCYSLKKCIILKYSCIKTICKFICFNILLFYKAALNKFRVLFLHFFQMYKKQQKKNVVKLVEKNKYLPQTLIFFIHISLQPNVVDVIYFKL